MGYQTVKIILVVVALLGLAAIWRRYWSGPVPVQGGNARVVKIGGAKLTVEVAATLPAQRQGLSNRVSLPSNGGMLFVYRDKDIRYFWMKDMRFPLDVLWLADGRVVGLQENIPPPAPGQEPFRFQSSLPADGVLEVNSGWIRKHNIKIGEQAVYPQTP